MPSHFLSGLRRVLMIAFAAATLQACGDKQEKKPALDVRGETAGQTAATTDGIVQSRHGINDARDGDTLYVNLANKRFPRTAADSLPRVFEQENKKGEGFPLRSSEEMMFNQLFDQMDLGALRVRLLKTKYYGPGDADGEGRVLGEFYNNTIVMHGRDAGAEDYARAESRLGRAFLMQLTHYWQMQTKQPAADGDEIRYDLDSSKTFYDYTAAQQRAMVADYYYRFISDLGQGTRNYYSPDGTKPDDRPESDALLKVMVEEVAPKAAETRAAAEKRRAHEKRLEHRELRKGRDKRLSSYD